MATAKNRRGCAPRLFASLDCRDETGILGVRSRVPSRVSSPMRAGVARDRALPVLLIGALIYVARLREPRSPRLTPNDVAAPIPRSPNEGTVARACACAITTRSDPGMRGENRVSCERESSGASRGVGPERRGFIIPPR